MSVLNLGILAHVDAGKTSLTERLLYEAGVLDAPGSVDEGTTRTDSMDLERRRGITIRAAVTSFELDALTVNVVDTPGHPDFIAEVERSLAVLDAAVLVVSAVEGVQPQTVVLWRALRQLEVPTVLFVNKVDRAGADPQRALAQIRRRLAPGAVLLSVVDHAGQRDVVVRVVDLTDAEIVDRVASVDDSLLRRWVDGAPIDDRHVRRALRRGIQEGALTPVLAGSAITGAGVRALQQSLVDLAPPEADPSPEAPAAGSVFAIDRDERGRRTWVRMWAGAVRPRDRLRWARPSREVVTEVQVSGCRGLERAEQTVGGQVAVLRGLDGSRVGDAFGPVPARATHHFPPATLQAVVEPLDPTRRGALFTALTELSDSDPLIDLRVGADGELAVSLHGEVQKEVVGSLLAEAYAVPVRFLETSTVCIERVVGNGASVDLPRLAGNPYLAGIGLRVESRPVGHGLRFSPGIERGNLPPAFLAATEEGVRAAYAQGLCGWEVTDCLVTMTQSAYFPRQSAMHARFSKGMSSVGADFRLLAQVVAMAALEAAGTRVCEPVERFDLEVPLDVLGAVAALLGPLGGLVESSTVGAEAVRLVGTIPSARIPQIVRALPDLARGEAVWTHRHDSYAAVPGRPPVRPRRGPDPRDRQTWFREMPR